MALSHVDRTRIPAAVWNYLIKATTLGKSYALYAANVACLSSLGIIGRFDSPGFMYICQSQVPVDSRQPVSMDVPGLLRTVTSLHVKVAAHSVSHRVPTPIKVWHNPGIRCPLIGNSDGRWGKSKLPVPAYCCVCPVAVPTLTLGAARFMLNIG